MTSKLTRERVVALIAEHSYDSALVDALEHLLAAMDSEPVAWTDEQELRDVDRGGCGYLFTVNPVTPHADERRIILLYRHAQPASEREQVRREHAEWSQATFGNVGPVGPLKHLSKEALEAAEQPGDLSEWADMQFLMWDAQRRAGITDEQITQAMIDKLAVNKQREWPEPKDGEPRLHIKGQPAPVVPDGYVMVPKEPTEAMMLHNSGCQHHAWDDPDCAMRQTRRLIWSHMLAAAPQEVK
ncbi:TPA: DUF550 domain-containing protein [Klebsiella quasipneumoniae subsp. similipneumoniae]|nr:DUF550 domain-containing protein [Klebsiella quasipneumoniae subsp. similipneumoniae]